MKEVDFTEGTRWFKDGVFRPQPQTSEPAQKESRQARSDSDPVLVGGLMTPNPITAEVGDTCDAALEALEEEDFHHLPVTSQDGVLVGVVSDRDLLQNPELTVGLVMKCQVLTASPETELQDAAKALIHQRFHCLVVVDDQAHPVGILTSYDILSFLVRHPALPLWQP